VLTAFLANPLIVIIVLPVVMLRTPKIFSLT
jgi:hypothetical protein